MLYLNTMGINFHRGNLPFKLQLSKEAVRREEVLFDGFVKKQKGNCAVVLHRDAGTINKQKNKK